MERVLKPLVFTAAALPAAWLAWQFWLAWTGAPNSLGAEPVEYLEHETGNLGLRFLAISLAVTPLRQLTGWNQLVKLRRMLGLFAFFYTTLHLVVFAALDLELRLGEVFAEIVKRPFITIGMIAWLLLLPLAITSTKGWIRRLGGRRWNRLHQLVYVAAVAGLIHFWWGQKKDVTEPMIFAVVFALLLGWRVWRKFAGDRPRTAAAGP